MSREIVWNRQPIDSQRVALVIRDAPLRDARDRVDLAWDDGRPFLIGIRSVRPSENTAAIPAWEALAAVIGAEVRDERSAPDVFAEADANNARQALAQRLEQVQRTRAAKRSNEGALGPLFGDVQGSLI